MMSGTDKERARLLGILASHGQSFLSSFALSTDGKTSCKRRQEVPDISTAKRQRVHHFSDEEEVWHGINRDAAFDFSFECGDGDEDEEDEDQDQELESRENNPQLIDENMEQPHETNVIIFSEPGSKKGSEANRASQAQVRAFMSSKIDKLTAKSGVVPTTKAAIEEEEDRTNAENDALLHKLLHTRLLSGSLNTELKLSPAQRRKALAGRVLELAGDAKFGKGEKVVREAEKNRAAKRIREGISQKQRERGIKELEQAKNLGNYHPTLKKLFETSGSGSSSRRRETGMKMGIGKFSDGTLKLSRNDLISIRGIQGRISPNKG